MATSEKVLFIDDEAPVRRAFSRSLGMHGHDIDLADGAPTALTMARDTDYAVIATDYNMPGIDGLELIADLKQLQPEATYILVTGQCDLELALEAINDHAVSHVVTKPWNTSELDSMLRRGIEAYWERLVQRAVQRKTVSTSRQLNDQQRRLRVAMAESEAFLSELLLNMIDLKGHETRAHCRRVAAFCVALAEEMGVRGQGLNSIRQGALLHDLGMFGVADGVVTSQAPLSSEQWQAIQRHPEMGAQVLDGFDSLSGAREIVFQHHESWDGTGYPQGLSGTQICLGARIFAVADALDGMLSKRPYSEPLRIDDAVKCIRRDAGKRFDPTVVEAFLSIDVSRWLAIYQAHQEEKEDRPRATLAIREA